MLIGVGVGLAGNPGTYRGATGAYAVHRHLTGKAGENLNLWAGEASVSSKDGRPRGYRHPASWSMAPRPGGMASYGLVAGSGVVVASGARGRAAGASLVGTATVAGTGALIVSAIAGLTGSGTVATAGLLAVLQAVGALSGTGTLAATRSALATLTGVLTGTGTVSATRYARGHLVAEISPFTDLSPQSLASAVWAATAADSDATGSMGEKLNDAGSATNPWTEVIEGSYTAAELLRVMAAALAGKLSGAGTTTIVIKGLDGTTDRIVATVTSDGDRTAVTVDGG
jgi:hypothetical protein